MESISNRKISLDVERVGHNPIRQSAGQQELDLVFNVITKITQISLTRYLWAFFFRR